MVERARAAGFSLIEVIVVIAVMSIMAGAIAPLALRQMNAARRAETRADMEVLLEAMIGSDAYGTHGYLGDVGKLPERLEDLNQPSRVPAWETAATGIGTGYAGPYAPGVRPGLNGRFVDGWNRQYRYSDAEARLVSDGPDGIAGSGDDLVVPPLASPTTGNLLVRVLVAPANGDPARALSSAEAAVWVSRSEVGRYREDPASPPTSGGGAWTASGIHLGFHAVRVRGAGRWSDAAEALDIVEIRNGSRIATLTLVDPGTGAAPLDDSGKGDGTLDERLSSDGGVLSVQG